MTWGKGFGTGEKTDAISEADVATVYLGGHGRFDETVSKNVPRGARVEWYGKKGWPEGAWVSKRILKGKAQWVHESVGGECIFEHYITATIGSELRARSDAFQTGHNDKIHYYLVQPKGNIAVGLSDIMTYVMTTIGKKWYRF